MEPAQVVGKQPRQQAEAVLAGVLLEVGVEATDHGDAQAPRRAQGTQTQRAFGGDVKHIRPLPAPAAQQFVHRHLAPLQTRVPRQRPAATQQQVVVAGRGLFSRLPRAYQLDPMAA
ncbi:hypothetical protein D3C76_1536070 [compost metagenome]